MRVGWEESFPGSWSLYMTALGREGAWVGFSCSDMERCISSGGARQCGCASRQGCNSGLAALSADLLNLLTCFKNRRFNGFGFDNPVGPIGPIGPIAIQNMLRDIP